ncbi:MAG: hypothetical protein AABY07_10855 [Nanoarchaeota archaeon]
MNNERILNIVVSVKNNIDPVFQKMSNSFIKFRDSALRAFASLNLALMVWIKTWAKVNFKILEVMGNILLLKGGLSILNKIVHTGWSWYKQLLALAVAYKLFQRFADHTLKDIFKWLSKIMPQHKAFFNVLSSQANKLQTFNPFTVISKSIQKVGKDLDNLGKKMQSNGGLRNLFGGGLLRGAGGVAGAAGKLVGSPGAIVGLGLLGATIGAFIAGISLAIKLSFTWAKVTLDAVGKIIGAITKLGAIMAVTFGSAIGDAIELGRRYETMTAQFANVIRLTHKQGTVSSVEGAAKERMTGLRKAIRRYPDIEDTSFLESYVALTMSGRDKDFMTAMRSAVSNNPALGSKLSKGNEYDKLTQILVDTSKAKNVAPERLMDSLSDAFGGDFRQLERDAQISRSTAAGYNAGNPRAGIFEALLKDAGTAERMKDTWDNIMGVISAKFKDEMLEVKTPAFDNIREFMAEVRDMFVGIFDSGEWKTAKENLKEIFHMFTGIGKGTLVQALKGTILKLLDIFNKPEMQNMFKQLAEGIQKALPALAQIAGVVSQELMKAVPALLQFTQELFKGALFFIFYLKDNFPMIMDKILGFADIVLKIWAKAGKMSIFVLYHLDDIISQISLKGSIQGTPFGETANNTYKFLGGIADSKKRFGGFDSFQIFGNNTINQTNAKVNSVMQPDGLSSLADATNRRNMSAKNTPSEGTAMPLSSETIVRYVQSLQQAGKHWEAINLLVADSTNKLRSLGKVQSMGQETLVEMGNAVRDMLDPAKIKDIQENFMKLIDLTDLLQEKVLLVPRAMELWTMAIKTAKEAAINVVDSIGGAFGPGMKNLFKQLDANTLKQLSISRLTEKVATDSGQHSIAQEERNKQIEYLKERYDKTLQLFELEGKWNKQILGGLEGIAGARRNLLEALNMDKGPLGQYQAERTAITESIQLTKLRLSQQQEELKRALEIQKAYGGQSDKIMDLQAGIINSNAELIRYEKTLRNIASPSLMEQVIGAPQRVLDMLPTAQQLHHRAKLQVGGRGGGFGFTTNVIPQLWGGNFSIGSNQFGANYLGSKFMPGHVFDNGLPNINYNNLYNQGNRDFNKLGTQVGDINARGDAAMRNQINVNPIVNIKIDDFEKQWDSVVAPKVKQMVFNQFYQLKNANARGFNR